MKINGFNIKHSHWLNSNKLLASKREINDRTAFMDRKTKGLANQKKSGLVVRLLKLNLYNPSRL